MSTPQLPTKMKALRQSKAAATSESIQDLRPAFQVATVDTPQPGPHECVIKVMCATLNPNDLLHVQGTYGGTSHIPVHDRAMGFEGAGVVVAVGAKVSSWLAPGGKMGARVAFYQDQGGAFAEYVLCPAMGVIPVPDAVSMSVAASSIVNRLTAQLITRQMQQHGQKALINTAAAGALGKLVLRVAQNAGLTVICIVRRTEQMEICQAEGAKYVLNSSEADFLDKLKQAVQETDCYSAYDCINGDMPNILLQALPSVGGAVITYGSLAGKLCTIDTNNLAMHRSLELFLVKHELDSMWTLPKLMLFRKLGQTMGDSNEASDVQKSFSIDEAFQAYAFYASNMTGGKIQIVMASE